MKKELKDLFREYADECLYARRRSRETVRTSEEAFRHFTNMVPEVVLADDISVEAITLFFKRIQTRERTVGKTQKKLGLKDSTIRSYGGRLKTFFTWMFSRGYILSNPFDKFSLPKVSYTDHRALTGEEVKKILSAAVQSPQNAFALKRDIAMVGIFTFCGLRRNELLFLELRDIDIFEGFVTVRAETSKSKITRKIPMNNQARLYLQEYLDERKKRKCTSQYLFLSNSKDRQLTSHGLKHWVKRLVRLSGVKFHVHRFRHTFAVNLAMLNVGIVKIQKLMGHADIKMTQTYLRSVCAEDMREDVNKLSFESLK